MGFKRPRVQTPPARFHVFDYEAVCSGAPIRQVSKCRCCPYTALKLGSRPAGARPISSFLPSPPRGLPPTTRGSAILGGFSVRNGSPCQLAVFSVRLLSMEAEIDEQNVV